MISAIEHEHLMRVAVSDRELGYKLRGLTAKVRFNLGASPIDLAIDAGNVVSIRPSSGDAEVTFEAPDSFWQIALAGGVPQPGYESLTMAMGSGLVVKGDFHTFISRYQSAWQRLYLVLREAAGGKSARRVCKEEPYRDTDTTVGRYKYVKANGVEARIYFEEAGSGLVPLLLQSTAGADGRQYRHLLANPDMQKRFRMIAYDLPYHGKSLPPLGVRWWEEPYKPTRESIMNWVVGIADALDLERPYFLGCSVGGQLALDLAAFHGRRFGAFVSLNGWYDSPPRFAAVDNNVFRSPAIAEDFPMGLILGATAPVAPEASAQEVYWIYRSNFPGVYAGDNDYFMHEHDLKLYGDRIDAVSTPVYAVVGEYDPSVMDELHGAAAVAKHVPGVVYVEAKGLGHFAPSDDPISFAEMILPIFDEILAKTASAPRARGVPEINGDL